jgi:hypothetical protein
MKILFWILSPLTLILILVFLIIALTNDSPGNRFKPYSLEIGLGFLVIAALIRTIYKKLYKVD